MQALSALPHPRPSTHPDGGTSQSAGRSKGQVGYRAGLARVTEPLFSGWKWIISEDDAVSPRTVPEALPLGHVSLGVPQPVDSGLG